MNPILINRLHPSFPFFVFVWIGSSLFFIQQGGWHLNTGAALIFCSLLILLAYIDTATFLLPNLITGTLLIFGLIFNSLGFFCSGLDSLIGAIGGYLFFVIFATLFYNLTRREGLGGGDIKLIAAIGAWLGWQNLIWVVLIASCLGSCFGLIGLLAKRHQRSQPLPFGPFLATAAIIQLGIRV